jgi:phenylacetate-CoA ligase
MIESFMPVLKTSKELKQIQTEGLRWTANHVYKNSKFYKEKFDKARVKPNMIKSLDDIRRLPFTTAEDFREDYPFPLLAVPMKDVIRIHASSGTTGKKKVVCYTKKDIDDWINMFCRCWELAGLTQEDKVQIAVGYGLWTAGQGFQLSVERYGAMAIPTGPGNMDLQCQFLLDFGSTVSAGTASFNLLLGEEVQKRGIRNKIRLRKATVGAERTSEAMVKKIKDLLGLEDTLDITGLTELYGPGMGIECANHIGHHYWGDYFILEIINPETLEPVRDGEIGEMVYTTLRKEAAPLVRYRSRDLSMIIPDLCPCGMIMPRHGKLIGRSDDMFIFRAVNIYPSQIDEILSTTQGIGSEYQVHLDRREDGKDYMAIKVERAESKDSSSDQGTKVQIEDRIKKDILVSSSVEILDYGVLPRSERKTKRIFDHRFE